MFLCWIRTRRPSVRPSVHPSSICYFIVDEIIVVRLLMTVADWRGHCCILSSLSHVNPIHTSCHLYDAILLLLLLVVAVFFSISLSPSFAAAPLHHHLFAESICAMHFSLMTPRERERERAENARKNDRQNVQSIAILYRWCCIIYISLPLLL